MTFQNSPVRTVPLGQTSGYSSLKLASPLILTIVRVEQFALAGISTLAVLAWQPIGIGRVERVGVFVNLFDV